MPNPYLPPNFDESELDIEDIEEQEIEEFEPVEFGTTPSLWTEAIVWGGIKNVPPLYKHRLSL
uniref:Uncharacterized protein n=1 Tax=uncultured marine virus TaxID=186617 RepID=A0A0F7L690_9VIRU|nr:hypothetical protein [uncultured marine virus]